MISRVGNYLSQSVYSVATPFHPFGGAVDIIVVQQQDGSFRSTPWYVRFGKFQGVLKGAEKVVKIEVNGVEADFHMYLDNSGEAYFIKEITPEKDNDAKDSNGSLESRNDNFAPESNNNNAEESTESDSEKRFYEFQDEDFGSNRYDNLENDLDNNDNNSEVVLFSVDGQILSAPISSMEEENTENVQLSTPQFHLGPVEAQEFEGDLDLSNESTWAQYLRDISRPKDNGNGVKKDDVFKSCLALNDLGKQQDETEGVKNGDFVNLEANSESKVSEAAILKDQDHESLKLKVENGSLRVNSDDEIVKDQDREESEYVENSLNGKGIENGCPASVTEEPQPYFDDNGNFEGPKQTRIEISLCGNLLRPGMGLSTASETFNTHRIPEEEFKISAAKILKNDSLVVKIEDKYFTWEKASHIVLGMAAYGLELPVEPTDAIPVDWSGPGPNEDTGLPTTPSGRRWRLWPIPFRRAKTLDHTNSSISTDDVFLDSESVFDSPQPVETTPTRLQSPQKQFGRTHVPTTEQISSLNLKDGQNMVSFIFSTRVLGVQKVDAHIYLWKWNARIVISDVDGTITKSDVLGQFMPLVGKDWTQSGVARLFSAIKENGYQLLFLSARAIVQAYLTRSFLINLKQDGKALPNGPVVISPDGLFPSLFREVIRRAPHEFKIACLEDIKALFPSDYNPFYAGFGNRDTDELSYRKIGIPKGKIFIINPKGEVAISHRVDMKGKSYTSLHTLVNDMFPPTSMVEQEDYNSWNYWRVPLPDVEL
ncbi:phosphatidate phosphatase PAH1-like [Bidens hawaiensis]|uniref:phosphatidate phosphatase PAH1-like n=1 Tax=Bidens hawaiensis TaxID=980011 RepID=UPI00404AC193